MLEEQPVSSCQEGCTKCWHPFHSGEQMEQVWAVRFLRDGSIGSGKVVEEGLKYTSFALTFGLSLVARQGERVSHRVRWLELLEEHALAEKMSSNMCTRCSSCSARKKRSPIPRTTQRVHVALPFLVVTCFPESPPRR